MYGYRGRQMTRTFRGIFASDPPWRLCRSARGSFYLVQRVEGEAVTTLAKVRTGDDLRRLVGPGGRFASRTLAAAASVVPDDPQDADPAELFATAPVPAPRVGKPPKRREKGGRTGESPRRAGEAPKGTKGPPAARSGPLRGDP